jgi:hypothetical protein
MQAKERYVAQLAIIAIPIIGTPSQAMGMPHIIARAIPPMITATATTQAVTTAPVSILLDGQSLLREKHMDPLSFLKNKFSSYRCLYQYDNCIYC